MNEETNQKKKLLLTAIIATSVIFVVVLILLIVLMGQESKKIKIQIGDKIYKTSTTDINANDGVYQQKTITYNNEQIPIFIVTPSQELFYCIETMSKLTGYRYNNGAYGDQVDESKDKCYIDNGGEYVTFVSNSNTITKNIKAVSQYNGELKVLGDLKRESESSTNAEEELEEEAFSFEKPVIQFDNKLYASYEAINKGFNLQILQDGSVYQILTLENLTNNYSSQLSAQGYTLTSNFRNQRALSDGYAVVGKNEEYGVVDLNSGNEVISLKYDSIEYIQSIGEFIVSSKSKFGMQKPGEASPTIKISYASIELLNAEKKLFIVQSVDNDKFGVLNANGKEIIPTEYDQIGLDTVEPYRSQGITNKYIIANECIPVKRNNAYGLYNLDGQILQSAHYLGFGCEDPSKIIGSTNALPTLTIPLSDTVTGIVFYTKNGSLTTYGLVTTNGTIVQNSYYSAIYYTQKNGVIEYCFDKPSNNEYKTLKELLMEPTVREMLNQTKTTKELEAETKRERDDIASSADNEENDRNREEESEFDEDED